MPESKDRKSRVAEREFAIDMSIHFNSHRDMISTDQMISDAKKIYEFITTE